MLNKTLVTAAAATALTAGASASAADWTKNVSLCATAAENEGLVTAGEYRAKFLRGGGGATKTISIELIPHEGDAMEAVCKIRRGEVSEIELAA
ncbi:hypothetical protein PUV54_02795 [Hyphococcus flavus]|uniref:Uncharacterized protein n=1 Tax=Hyphococcus flavus TaxID=1866326 RepID=A0AAE9ZFS7_9PROT|nr:hypothetical protein [Hyphococcus flavus]WDI32118.1 hypothetical protein PUV54_02795 [Hyphococcus flavus]